MQFAKKWLPDFEDHNGLAQAIVEAGSDEKYDKYLKCGQAAFLRFDAGQQEEIREENITQHSDDLARALGVPSQL